MNDMNCYCEPQCEEVYNEDDHYGVVRPEDEKPYDGWSGFPGCGDGQDDFADYNQNEGRDW